MRNHASFGLISISAAALALTAFAQTTGTTTLTVTPGSAVVGQPVTLTASVAPPGSTGEVTFYDGVSVLGVSSIAGGQAIFSTNSLLSGPHKFLARVAGAGHPQSNAVVYNVTPISSYDMVTAAASPFAAGSDPLGVVVGDFNEDGVADVALGNYGSNDVSVLLGSGDGTGGFRPAIRIPLANPATSLAAADFGNGHLDLAVATAANTIVILMGDGHGGFTQTAGPIPLPGNGIPDSIVAADFNADGEVDLAVAREQTSDVVVLLGNGTGGFQSTPLGPFSVGSGRNFAAVGDFNGDGFPDLAVISIGTYNVTILLNKGDSSGNLTPLAPFPSGFNFLISWASITTADFNGDGKTDLAIAGYGIAVLLGNGDGTFNSAPGSPLLTSTLEVPYAVAAADLNGDGFPDLAIGTAGIAEAAVLLGDGNGGFSSPSYFPFGAGAGGDSNFVAVGDFNNDGRPDLVFAILGNSVPVLLGSPLTVNLVRSGAAAVGQGGTFQITVQNQSSGNVTGEVTVVDNFPAGLQPTAASGTGWTCNITGQSPPTPNTPKNVTCTRSDGLPANMPYSPISVNVIVTGAACQSSGTVLNVNDQAQVFLSNSAAGTYTESTDTQIVQCFTINVTYPPLVATQSATLTVNLAAAPGASIPSDQGLQTTVSVLGLVPTSAGGTGWTCTPNGASVTCARSGSPGSGGQYPPIQIAGVIDPSACPTAPITATVFAGGPLQTSFLQTTDLYGCLTVAPPSLNIGTVPFFQFTGQPNFVGGVYVSSLDTHPLKVTAAGYNQLVSGTGSGNCVGNVLNLGDSCSANLVVFNSCTTSPSGTLTITADAGMGLIGTYTVPIQGSAQLSSFAINVNGGNLQLQPGQTYPVKMSPLPTPDPVNCPENVQPTLAVGFSPLTPDPNYSGPYDAGWYCSGMPCPSTNPAQTMFYAGTVAGTFTLTAQINNQNIQPLSGSNQITFQVPSTVAVVQNVSIENKSKSSFQVVVDAYSPPRETGPNAQTQVCLTFLAASGAKIQDNAASCALQQDIVLWYNEAGSYQYGSQFAGYITVSYNGDQSAIGSIQVIVKNIIGDSTPYCVDFKSGNKITCP